MSRRIPLLVALVATAALSLASSASATVTYVSPRVGHYCGFESSIEVDAAKLIPPHPSTYLNACLGLQVEGYQSLFGTAREPVSMYIAHQASNSHYYMSNFRWGYDYIQYIVTGDLGQSAVPANASHNGKSVDGGFPASGFYKGMLNHGSYKRHVYLWWVGHKCAAFTSFYNHACTSN